MANAFYTSAKVGVFTGLFNFNTDTIKAALIDTGVYGFNAAHDFWDDVVAGAVGTPQTLGSKTFTGGVFDAADSTFPTVTGASCEAIVLYKDTGTPSTSPLIMYLDTGVTGIPVTPNGGNITIQWNGSGIIILS